MANMTTPSKHTTSSRRSLHLKRHRGGFSTDFEEGGLLASPGDVRDGITIITNLVSFSFYNW